MIKQSSCEQPWEALKMLCCSPSEIPDSQAIPVVPHPGQNIFPIPRNTKLQSVDILKRLTKTIFAFQESLQLPQVDSGGNCPGHTLPSSTNTDVLHAKDTSCPTQPSQLLKAQFSSGIFFIIKFWEQTPQPSQVLLSTIHHPRFQLTEHLQGKPQLGTVLTGAEGTTSGAILADQRQLMERKAGHLNMKIWNSVHISSEKHHSEFPAANQLLGIKKEATLLGVLEQRMKNITSNIIWTKQSKYKILLPGKSLGSNS